MSHQVDALYAVTMQGDHIVRVVQAPHVLGWGVEEYRVWAWQLTYSWGECFQRDQKLVMFAVGEDLDEVRQQLEEDKILNLEAFDSPVLVEFDEFNDIVGGKSL